MKRVVQVRLLPSDDQSRRLAATLNVCNEAANFVSRMARARNIRNKFDLQKVSYGQVKPQLGAAQPVCLTVSKVHAAHATHRANLKAGRYGKRGTDRRKAAEIKVISFRPDSAQPYDDRILTWKHDQQVVSIWVTDTGSGKPGRILVPFAGKAQHLQALAAHRKGESDLVYRPDRKRDSAFYLIATLEVPEGNLILDPDLAGDTTASDWLGTDVGITNIAYTSDGANWSGGAVTHVRKKNKRIRATAQAKGTRSAKRLLKKRARREARFARNTNHVISKQIVAEAKRTGRGIALEDLTGIRARARHRKPQRATFHSWAFRQLAGFIAYKAEAAGVPVVHVDPAYTSQTCHRCGHVDNKARNGEHYTCTNPATLAGTNTVCGFVGHADHNGALNIAHLAPAAWRIYVGGLSAVSHAAAAA